MGWSKSVRGLAALAIVAGAAGVGFYVLRGVIWPDDSVDAYVARMSSSWPASRREAATGLGRFTDDPAKAVPALTAALGDPDAGVRSDALESLLLFRDASRPAASRAAEILRTDGDPGVRRRAAALLGWPQDPATAPALVEAMADQDQSVRVEAVKALGRFGRRGKEDGSLAASGPALIEAFRNALDPDQAEDLRSAAVDALDSFCGGDPAVVGVIAGAATKDASPAVRRKAVSLLRREYPATIPTLIAAVEDTDPTVLIEATGKLARIGVSDERSVTGLARAAARADARAREGVAMNIDLLNLHPAEPPPPEELTRRFDSVVRDLRTVAESPSAAGREAAVTVLCRVVGTYERNGDPALLGPAKAALDGVVALIDDPKEDEALRSHAMDQWEIVRTFIQYHMAHQTAAHPELSWGPRWIEAMGRRLAEPPDALRRKAASILLDALHNDDGAPGVREAWKTVLPQLTAALDSDDPNLRGEVVKVLEALGPGATPALGALKALAARETDAAGKAAVEKAIASIGNLDGLKSAKPEDRAAAAAGLARMGWRAAEAAPALAETLSDPDPQVRAAAASALAGLGKAAEGAEGALLKALAVEKEPAVREAMLRASAAIKPSDPSVLAVQVAALGDASPAVRATAAAFENLPADEAVVKALTKNLADAGPPGRAAADALARMFFFSPGVATEVARVLREGPEGTLPEAILERFQAVSPSAEMQMRSQRPGLPRLGAVATEATPALVEAATSAPAGARREAAYASLARLVAFARSARSQADRDAAGPALEPFIALLSSGSEEDAELREMAVDELSTAPTRRAEAATALLKEYDRVSDPEARDAILAGLAGLATRVDEDPALADALKPAIPKLATLLDDPDFGVRLDGVRALGCLGPAARDFEPALKKLAENESRVDVRNAAEAAVKAVRGEAKMPRSSPRGRGGGPGELMAH